MTEKQGSDIRQLRRLYLGRLGNVLRQRQAINAQLRSAVPSSAAGRRPTEAQYLEVRTSTVPCNISDQLRIPCAGWRKFHSGSECLDGCRGLYWHWSVTTPEKADEAKLLSRLSAIPGK